MTAHSHTPNRTQDTRSPANLPNDRRRKLKKDDHPPSRRYCDILHQSNQGRTRHYNPKSQVKNLIPNTAPCTPEPRAKTRRYPKRNEVNTEVRRKEPLKKMLARSRDLDFLLSYPCCFLPQYHSRPRQRTIDNS